MNRSETASPPVFNRVAFDRLTMGDPALQAQLLDAFLRELPRARESLPVAAVAGGQEFSDLLHRLQNTCQFMAADRLLSVLKAASGPRGPKTLTQRASALHQILRELDDLEAELLPGPASPEGR